MPSADAVLDRLRASALGVLPDPALRLLARGTVETVDHGELLIREGDPSADLFVILDGTAHVVSGDDVVAVLGPGDLAGELVLLTDEPVRTASVVAEGPLQALRVTGSALDAALREAPDAAAALRQAADRVVVARLLRGVAPLAGLDDRSARALASKVQERTFAAGQDIVVRGAPSDRAYVLRSGTMQILAPDGVAPPVTLGPGALVGEVGVLSGEPRSATVRAAQDCRVLELSRDDVLGAMADVPGFSEGLVHLMRLRERPRRTAGVEAHDRQGEDGEPLTILKDPARGRYFRLSALGRFVWDRLDGTRNVRDLAIAYADEQGRFAPQPIADIVAALGASGFVEMGRLRVPAGDAPARPSAWARATDAARRALTWHVDVRHVDERFGRLYRRLRFLYTRPGRIGLAVLALAGAVAFVWPLAEGGAWPGSGHPALVWLLIPAVLLGFVVHELGHALTVKAVGREVHRAGVGWFWLGPMAFVDVSDTWLSTRRERLAVALAGPAATALLAGVAAIVATVSGPVVGGALWLYALSSYVSIVQNLNPLIELDGYYVLVHWLDRPNLRPTSLAWLRDEGPGAIRHPSRIRGHGLEAGYAAGSIAYLIGSAILVVVAYRALLEGWVAGWAPAGLAAGLGWVIAGVVVLATVAGVAGELRTAGRPTT